MTNEKQIDDGGPAFPVTPSMSLRQYFAGQAMAAMIGCFRTNLRGTDGEADIISFGRDLGLDRNHVTGEHDGCNEIARDAVCFADALIAALKEKPK